MLFNQLGEFLIESESNHFIQFKRKKRRAPPPPKVKTPPPPATEDISGQITPTQRQEAFARSRRGAYTTRGQTVRGGQVLGAGAQRLADVTDAAGVKFEKVKEYKSPYEFSNRRIGKRKGSRLFARRKGAKYGVIGRRAQQIQAQEDAKYQKSIADRAKQAATNVSRGRMA